MDARMTARIRAVEDASDEAERASALHPPFNSPHEGWAVIKEEIDELWEEVRKNNGRGPEARIEAIQIAAMAINYAAELTGVIQ